ncbi:MAG: hypothetical protein H5T91_01890 [Synergistetes bacterium]|nr:MAG: hypothetical protein XD52_0329 [bacterium 42_11]MBC7331170.1 hypothetical protein [Synergistota bacterium]
MKRILLTAILIFLLSGIGLAHPPSSIEAYVEENSLKLKIKHLVSNPSDHYINSVKVFRNGNLFFDQTFDKQDSRDGLQLEISIKNIESPTKLLVEATCNKWGTLRKEIEIK